MKSENEKLRGLLKTCLYIGVLPTHTRALIEEVLSQQAEPCEFHGGERAACEQYSGSAPCEPGPAQGFRDAAKDEAEPVYQFQWREIGEGDWMACSHSWFRFCEASTEHDTRVVEVARPAQTAPQPEQSGLPEELFDGYAVYQETVRHRRDSGLLVRTSPENVSDTLDAAVRLIKARRAALSAQGPKP